MANGIRSSGERVDGGGLGGVRAAVGRSAARRDAARIAVGFDNAGGRFNAGSRAMGDDDKFN